VNGARTASATVQRQKVSATGGALKRSQRPTTKFPAQQSTASASTRYAGSADFAEGRAGVVTAEGW